MRKSYDRVHSYYANDNTPFIPTIWARESIAILEETMVMGNLVHRDFSDEIADFGDTVKTRKPNEFTAKRKTDADSVTIQDASSVNVDVKLDQHVHVSFMIKDGESSKSFADLVRTYLRPAMLAEGRFIDRMLSGAVHRFQANRVGALRQGSSSTIRGYMVDANTQLNIQKVGPERNMIVTPQTEGFMLNTDLFVSAEKVGDQGTALREANIGRKFGFNVFMAQNQPSVLYKDLLTATNLASAAVAGAQTVVSNAGHSVVSGTYLSIPGDYTPQLVTNVSTNTFTISPGLRNDVGSGAVYVAYAPGAVALAEHTASDGTSAYPAGYSKEIWVDAFDATNAPQLGQQVRISTATSGTLTGPMEFYTIIDISSRGSGGYKLTLDRPLDSAIPDNGIVAVGPTGEYNLCFHRNAIALVNRPLALPQPGTGALAGIASNHNISMRVTITYNGEKQGHLVTVDGLFGYALLDVNKGLVMYC